MHRIRQDGHMAEECIFASEKRNVLKPHEKKKALARALHAEISNEELDALAEKLLEYEK